MHMHPFFCVLKLDIPVCIQIRWASVRFIHGISVDHWFYLRGKVLHPFLNPIYSFPSGAGILSFFSDIGYFRACFHYLLIHTIDLGEVAFWRVFTRQCASLSAFTVLSSSGLCSKVFLSVNDCVLQNICVGHQILVFNCWIWVSSQFINIFTLVQCWREAPSSETGLVWLDYRVNIIKFWLWSAWLALLDNIQVSLENQSFLMWFVNETPLIFLIFFPSHHSITLNWHCIIDSCVLTFSNSPVGRFGHRIGVKGCRPSYSRGVESWCVRSVHLGIFSTSAEVWSRVRLICWDTWIKETGFQSLSNVVFDIIAWLTKKFDVAGYVLNTVRKVRLTRL